jgi:hypothetical protein
MMMVPPSEITDRYLHKSATLMKARAFVKGLSCGIAGRWRGGAWAGEFPFVPAPAGVSSKVKTRMPSLAALARAASVGSEMFRCAKHRVNFH